jgi:hypothetical protein
MRAGSLLVEYDLMRPLEKVEVRALGAAQEEAA